MEAVLPKKTTFRLNPELLEGLKEMAREQKKSLNAFVEGILFDVLYTEPNEETLAAMRDAKEGKFEGGELDTSSVEAMLKSMGL